MPGRKLPGKLEQLERAGASLLHNSRAAAAGREDRSPAPAGSPHPCRGAWPQGSGPRRELRATPETRAPDPLAPCRHPERLAPAARSRLLQSHTPGWGLGCGAGVTAAGSLGTLHRGRVCAPWRPRARSAAGFADQHPREAGGNLRQEDPSKGRRLIRLHCPRARDRKS